MRRNLNSAQCDEDVPTRSFELGASHTAILCGEWVSYKTVVILKFEQGIYNTILLFWKKKIRIPLKWKLFQRLLWSYRIEKFLFILDFERIKESSVFIMMFVFYSF